MHALRGNTELALEFVDGKTMPFAAVRLDNEVSEPDPGEPVDPCGGTIASVTVGSDNVQMYGPLLDRTAWQNMGAALELDAGPFKLQCLARLATLMVPGKKLPIQDIAGTLHASARVRRVPAGGVQLSGLSFQTDGLPRHAICSRKRRAAASRS